MIWLGIAIGALIGGGLAAFLIGLFWSQALERRIRARYESNLTEWEKSRIAELKTQMAAYEKAEVEKARTKAAEEYEHLKSCYADFRSLSAAESAKIDELQCRKDELNQVVENYKAAIGRLFDETYKARAHSCDLEIEAYRLECNGKKEIMAEAAKADEANWAAAHAELEELVAHCQDLARFYNERINGSAQELRCKLNGDQIEEVTELWKAVKGLRVVNPAPLYKAIFEMYLRGPIKDMLNGATDGGGIYCITDCVTKLSYVGKTTNFKDRWLTHLKRGGFYEEGTAAGSALYAAMKEHGVWNFKFEVLEEVEDMDKLSEKEKMWIEELDTVKNGLNMKAGG